MRPSSFRRLCAGLLIAAVAAFLLTPGVVQVLVPDPSVPSENRAFARWPAWPRSAGEAFSLPARIEAYFQDHFGLRYQMIAASNRLRYALFGQMPSQQVIEGRNGRLFLTTHDAATPFALLDVICGAGVSEAAINQAAQSIAAFLRRLPEAEPRSLLAVIPSSPAIYPEDLPAWRRRQCDGAEPVVARIAARLPPDVLGAWAYPLEEELRLKQQLEMYPRTGFHWIGEAAGRVIGHIAEQHLGLERHIDVPGRPRQVPSDLGQFMPGLWFSSMAELPDWRRAGVEACDGPACFPELGDITKLFPALSRFRSSQAGPKRLLILSDSFGTNAAGYFAPYAGEVQHFSTNDFALLSSEQAAAFRRYVLDEYRPDLIVFLYHDGNVMGLGKNLAQILWP